MAQLDGEPGCDAAGTARRPKAGGAILCNVTVTDVRNGQLARHRCGKRFWHISSTLRHQQTHWVETCFSCLDAVPPRQMRAHTARCAGWRACRLCSATFKRRADYIDHVNAAHRLVVRELTASRTRPETAPPRTLGTEKRHACADCGATFTRKDNLQKHMRLRCRLPDPATPCPDCGATFTFRRLFSYHVKHSCADLPH